MREMMSSKKNYYTSMNLIINVLMLADDILPAIYFLCWQLVCSAQFVSQVDVIILQSSLGLFWKKKKDLGNTLDCWEKGCFKEKLWRWWKGEKNVDESESGQVSAICLLRKRRWNEIWKHKLNTVSLQTTGLQKKQKLFRKR